MPPQTLSETALNSSGLRNLHILYAAFFQMDLCNHQITCQIIQHCLRFESCGYGLNEETATNHKMNCRAKRLGNVASAAGMLSGAFSRSRTDDPETGTPDRLADVAGRLL